MNAEMLKKLNAPFAPTKVKQKPGPHGRPLDYISHGLVTERLTEADPIWSSALVAEHTYPDKNGVPHCAGVTLALTVGGVTRVESGGPQRQDGFANEIKNAYSDALKRAAMRFGIALEIWENLVDAVGDEDIELAIPVKQEPVKAVKVDPPVKDKRPGTPLTRLHKLAQLRGLEDESNDPHKPLRWVCMFLLPSVPAKDGSGYVALTSMEQLSEANLEYLYTKIEDMSEEAIVKAAVDWEAAIKAAKDTVTMRQIANDLASIGATKETHSRLFNVWMEKNALIKVATTKAA